VNFFRFRREPSQATRVPRMRSLCHGQETFQAVPPLPPTLPSPRTHRGPNQQGRHPRHHRVQRMRSLCRGQETFQGARAPGLRSPPAGERSTATCEVELRP
jgi:hypothetical protein